MVNAECRNQKLSRSKLLRETSLRSAKLWASPAAKLPLLRKVSETSLASARSEESDSLRLEEPKFH